MPTISETIKKVNEFADWRTGWHFGSGVPPSEDMRRRARVLLWFGEMEGFTTSNAFLGIDGEIMITFYEGSTYLEFSFELDGSVNFVHEEAKTEVCYQEGLSVADAIAKLADFEEKEKWATSVSSIIITTIPSRKKLKATPSEIPAMEAGSRSLRKNVPFKTILPSATIFKLIIPPSPMILPSFGLSPMEFYQTPVEPFNLTVSQAINATTTFKDSETGQPEDCLRKLTQTTYEFACPEALTGH